MPYIRAAGEIKTKPTQQSVRLLREIGIQPDILICRTETELPLDAKRKIALFCNVDEDAVFEERDVATSIYEIPEVLVSQKVDKVIVDTLGLEAGVLRMDDWTAMLERVRNPKGSVRIAVVGKYIELQDAYKSIYEALAHAGAAHAMKVEVDRIEAEDLEKGGPGRLEGFNELVPRPHFSYCVGGDVVILSTNITCNRVGPMLAPHIFHEGDILFGIFVLHDLTA